MKMPMTNLLFSSACSMASALQNKTLSSVELIEMHLRHIEEVNPRINAVVQFAAERALQEARDADVALAKGKIRGPLHGVPITIKDSFDTEGIVSTGGTKGREFFIPPRDAVAVARLRDAGAIVLGKTNTTELTVASITSTENSIYGRTNNPYDLSRTTSASSGGAAAIIAAGGAPLDLGSDTGGSIRDPAHNCGIAGIKPTSGRVPKTGHIVSYGLGPLDYLTQIGPMARYVEDLALTLPLICGPDGFDPGVINMKLGNPHVINLKELRVATYTDNGVCSPNSEVTATVRSAARSLRGAVAALEERIPTAI